MLREIMEKHTGEISDQEFKILCAVLTADIKFNRVGYQRHTYLDNIEDLLKWYATLKN